MSTITTLLSGLSGAGGCKYRPALNQLLYVEYGGNLSSMSVGAPVHAVLGTGYTNPEDVAVSNDGHHVYITERSGNLVKVALATPNRASATVIASGMIAPQQMALDEAHNAAYVVEYAPSGHLYKINLATHVKTAVPGVTLNNAVGLILTADRQFAFVTEQTSPGRVRKIHLASGVSTVVATGFIAPFFLTWADAAETTLLVPERNPANRITSIDIATGTTHLVIGGLADRPGAIAMINPARMLVHGEATISLVDFLPFLPSGPLFMGIGFVPFDKVVQSGPNTGLADTTSAPAYFYQVHNAPFGGTLPIMINHPAAAAAGATFYRIKIDGAAHLDTWTDQKWNGTTYVPETLAPAAIGAEQGFFPVRTSPFQYLNPALGSLLNSTNLPNGLRRLSVDFVKVVAGLPVTVATSPTLPAPYQIRIDNNPCVGVLAAPVVGGVAANQCGLLHYTATGQVVTMGFTATHPNNFATYSFSLIRGHNSLPAPVLSGATSGPVSAAPGAITGTVAGLMGSCVNIAAFAESLYVYATAINGWGRQSQYDASDLLAFTLTN